MRLKSPRKGAKGSKENHPLGKILAKLEIGKKPLQKNGAFPGAIQVTEIGFQWVQKKLAPRGCLSGYPDSNTMGTQIETLENEQD